MDFAAVDDALRGIGASGIKNSQGERRFSSQHSSAERVLQVVYFPIPVKYADELREATKKQIVWNVRRDSATNRVESFVDFVTPTIEEIEHRVSVKSKLPLLDTIADHVPLLSSISLALIIVLNLLMLFAYTGEGTTQRDFSCVDRREKETPN